MPQQFVTQQQMIDAFSERELIQLTDHSQSGQIDSAVLDRAMQSASGTAASYVAVQYALPLASIPDALIDHTSDLARFELYEDRATPEVNYRYEAAIRWLERLAAGKVRLVGLDDQLLNQAQGGPSAPVVHAPCEVFSQSLFNKMLSWANRVLP